MIEYNSVQIERRAMDAMILEASSYPRLETGGVLCGIFYEKKRYILVTHATDGGPNSQRNRHNFLRDGAYCQQEVEQIHNDTFGQVRYIGEWHKHCHYSVDASRDDELSLCAVAHDPGSLCPQPLMLILGMPDETRTDLRQLRAWTWTKSGLMQLPALVLPRVPLERSKIVRSDIVPARSLSPEEKSAFHNKPGYLHGKGGRK